MGAWVLASRSARQTRNWGKRLGRRLAGGEIIALVGDLGAGKTCFVRGVAEALDVPQTAWIRSPTFTLINEYLGRLPVFHIDLYRVGSRAELEGLNLREYLYADGVSLIEWFDHLPSGEVDEFLELKISHVGRSARELAFAAHGERYEKLLEAMKSKS